MRSEIHDYNLMHKKKETQLFIFINKIRLWICCKLFKKIPLGSEKWLKMQHKVSLLSATTMDCKVRSSFYEITLKEHCKGNLYCLQNVCINFPHNVFIGDNVFVNRNVNIVAREIVEIGSNVLIGPNVVINSGSHNYMDTTVLIRNQGHKKAPIIISDNVCICANVVILPGVTIGTGSIIGAGAVVTKSIPEYSVAVGIPAKVIKNFVI